MIELLDHTGSDNSIANTARVSMQFDGSWNELPVDYNEENRDKLIKYLATHNHTSPFRHNSIIIRCDVPIFLARQLGKHQVGMSWNEVSRRYVDTDVMFYYPKEWRTKPDGSIKQGSGDDVVTNMTMFDKDFAENITDTPQRFYDTFVVDALYLYNSMLKAGVAPEQARMVLPQSMMTQFIWTGSLMAFAHVYKLRVDGHAQVEAQEFAKKLDSIIRPLFPVSWRALVGE